MKTDKTNLKIYITTHLDNTLNINNETYSTINTKKLYPVLNRIFSEYVTMHYIYEQKLYSNYIGFCSYRRKIYEYQIELKENSIQYFYCHNETFPIVNNELSYLKYWVSAAHFPKSLYKDICEFLKSQNYIPYSKIKKYFNSKDFKLYCREVFLTDYKLFEKLVKFIDDYIYFIKDKYNIQTEEDWKQHIIDKYIMYHRRIFFEIIGSGEMTHALLYQTRNNYHNIFNEDYGFSSPICNSWRVYSYIIEILISMFIATHNHHETILNKDDLHAGFNMLNHQYEHMWNLLQFYKPTNICELGSGYSTMLFDKYIKEYQPTGKLISIEHQNNEFELIDGDIQIGNTIYDSINKYDKLEEYLINLNLKYDFVLIDGPYAWMNYLKYGRIQMLDFIEYDLLSDKGIFIIHDSERKSTKKTINTFIEKLINKNYKYLSYFLNKNEGKELMIIQFYK